MDTEALIDRIRSLRDRIDVPASPTKKPVYQPELAEEPKPAPNDHLTEDQTTEPAVPIETADQTTEAVLEPNVEPNIEPNVEPGPDIAQNNSDDDADDQPDERSTKIADNLAAAMSSLNEDVYDVYANKSDVTALDMRMQMIENKLKKTQDMIVTLNRAVGRLIDYEEKHAEPALLMEQQQRPVSLDPKQATPEQATPEQSIPEQAIPEQAIPEQAIMVLDKVAPDKYIPDNPTSQLADADNHQAGHGTPKKRSYHSLWYVAATIMLTVLYFIFASSSTTSNPASSLPDSDAFLGENEMAVYSHIEMGMARPLGLTSLEEFSARMWEKGVDLAQYYECMVSIMEASTKPMNQMMIIELLDNPLRSDYNPAVVDRQRALFESRYGSANHYGGYNRAQTNIASCRNW